MANYWQTAFPVQRVLTAILLWQSFSAVSCDWTDCAVTQVANYSQYNAVVLCTFEYTDEVKSSSVKIPVGVSNPALKSHSYNKTSYFLGNFSDPNPPQIIELKTGESDGAYSFDTNKMDGKKLLMTLHIDQVKPQTLRPYIFQVTDNNDKEFMRTVHLDNDPKGMTYKEYTGDASSLKLSLLTFALSLVALQLH